LSFFGAFRANTLHARFGPRRRGFLRRGSFPRGFGLPHRPPPLLRRRDDSRAPLGDQAAFLPGGHRWRRRRRGSLGLPRGPPSVSSARRPCRRAAGLKIRLGLRRARTRPSFRSPAAP
jgi:hypothetical protein